MISELKSKLVATALAEGFETCRICAPSDVDITEKLGAFTEAGHHGQMGWMEERQHWRARPDMLWPAAKSVIMLGEPYGFGGDALAGLSQPDHGNISVYARGKDYHDLVKKRLKRVGRWLIEAAEGAEIKVFVDTAPVPEKPLGQAAGLGWQGKHTNLVSRQMGSWFFIGAIFTTLDFAKDTAEVDHCGSCRACLDICPTNAFPAPYQLDARRCISYLTIEHKGPVDEGLRAGLGNRIYGCDDCLAACPWNKFASDAKEMRYAASTATDMPALAELATLDDAGFRARFSGSPIKRIGRDRFVRNVLYAIGNSRNAGLIEAAQALSTDPDAAVADAARWAIRKLGGIKPPANSAP